ncbi:MAG: phosphomannomutase/phosphoglucomutase [Gammaproteobacteria bacterium]|nr:phosphomannomutase/phosphoglucomutase [Gammaproteobacteria bacterium]NKB63949.1 phosphomannomutase/phosphoglucomutase [Gammaproteobacteria bacterium]
MTFPHEIFKAYDIRGVVETALTPDMVELIGKSLGSESIAQGMDTVVVGRDGRLTGPDLVNALCRGLVSTGCNVIDIGQVPTPALYFTTVESGTGTGVQVTGSHNPPEYNGLKMMIGGTTLSGQAIQDLKARILRDDFIKSEIAGNIEYRDMLPVYCERIVKDVVLKRPMKVVIDCGNGVGGAAAPAVFRNMGCEVVELFCEVDGTFPNHHPDPSQLENLQDLIAAVRESDAEFGMAFDGDADRLGVVSKNGDVIWPDRQMLLFAKSILQQTPGAEIIYDVKCSQILPQAIVEAGGVATMWKTGHSFIKTKLKETGAALAGEMSGHIFFNDRWGGFDDGIYAGARLCELLSEMDDAPEAVFAGLPNTINTPELRLEMKEGEHYPFVAELVEKAVFSDARVSTIDGIRVDFEDGFGLIRASNTTPTVIMRFEAGSESQLEIIQGRFRELLYAARPDLALPF